VIVTQEKNKKAMRILIFTHSLAGGGAERVAANMANYWDEKGWRVTVVTLAGLEKDFYSLNSSVHRITLNQDQESSNPIVGLYRNLVRVISLRTILKQERPSIALSLMWSCNILLALASYGLKGLTTIGSEHTHPPKARASFIWRGLRKWSYGGLSAVTALTTQTAIWIKENTTARHVVVIQNAIKWPIPKSEPIVLPADKGFLPEHKVILAVGRLVKLKQIDALIEAFSGVSSNCPDWRLAIVGDGPEREALEKLITEKALQDKIALVGLAGNVGDWYGVADIYVMTSVYEGLPNTLIEALSYGVPAISFDCDSGPREIIRHGIDGFLVPPNDVVSLTAKLDELIRNYDLRDQLSTKAKEARDRFSLERVSEEWEILFSRLINDKPTWS
jgi:glycosyltransferase involved in cell wall biosynthesis